MRLCRVGRWTYHTIPKYLYFRLLSICWIVSFTISCICLWYIRVKMLFSMWCTGTTGETPEGNQHQSQECCTAPEWTGTVPQHIVWTRGCLRRRDGFIDGAKYGCFEAVQWWGIFSLHFLYQKPFLRTAFYIHYAIATLYFGEIGVCAVCCQKHVVAQKYSAKVWLNFGTRSAMSAKTSASAEHYKGMFLFCPLLLLLRRNSLLSWKVCNVFEHEKFYFTDTRTSINVFTGVYVVKYLVYFLCCVLLL